VLELEVEAGMREVDRRLCSCPGVRRLDRRVDRGQGGVGSRELAAAPTARFVVVLVRVIMCSVRWTGSAVTAPGRSVPTDR